MTLYFVVFPSCESSILIFFTTEEVKVALLIHLLEIMLGSIIVKSIYFHTVELRRIKDDC